MRNASSASAHGGKTANTITKDDRDMKAANVNLSNEDFEKLKAERISVVEKLETLPALHAMMRWCSGREKDVLMFIWLRVTGWGKKIEHIRPVHFIDGVSGGEGELCAYGLGIAPRHLRTHINSLIKKGFINRDLRTMRGKANWPWYSINFERGLNMLKQPKPKKNKEKMTIAAPKIQRTTSVLSEADNFCPHTNPEILKPRNTERKNTAPTARKPRNQVKEVSVKEKIQESLARAADKSKAASDKKQAKAEKLETVPGLETAWAAEVKSIFPEYRMQGWTRKDSGMAAQLRKKWAADNNGDKLAPFLKWAVQNWSRMMAAKFSWMNNPAAPIYPKLDFLIWKKQEFIECFSDEKFLTQQLPITSRDKEIMLLKRRGMTQAQAVEEVDRREVKSKFTDDLIKEKQEAEWYAIANKQKADKLEKENRELVNAHGKELQEKWKRGEDFVNRGSSPLKPNKEYKYDAEGYII